MLAVKELHVNGEVKPLSADPARTLLSVLRDDLGLTGAKYGCGEGLCGACTVIVDGKAVRSCSTRIGTTEGKKISTIESLTTGEKLHAIQEAFLAVGSLQCGYCTPGMIMSTLALLTKNPDPTREEIIQGMNGNICRCGTYFRIIAAIEQAAKAMKGEKK
jgi:aerobic-type carbon monoxide dehydrogenase small subunit (CoxS/CutS family)